MYGIQEHYGKRAPSMSLAEWLGSWWGPTEEQEVDAAIQAHTAFVEKDGQWSCFIRRDITRQYIKRYVILYFRDKGFQAISTGPRSITFQQDGSNRRCWCSFARVFQQKKRMRIRYLEGDVIDPFSPTAVFFQSILMELAYEMGKAHMLHEQRPDPLPDLPHSLEAVSHENTMLKPNENQWVAFLCNGSTEEAKKLFRRYATTHQFEVTDSAHALHAVNSSLHLCISGQTGYNKDDEPLLSCVYGSTKERKKEDVTPSADAAVPSGQVDDEGEAEAEGGDDSTIVSTVATSAVAQTGDPDLRRGDQEYFHSFFLGLGRTLAQYELLRTQSFAKPAPQRPVVSMAGGPSSASAGPPGGVGTSGTGAAAPSGSGDVDAGS